MARQLTDINTSGELTDIKIGGTDAEDSVATKEYVDADKAYVDYIPDGLVATYKEGRTFYDDEHKALSVYTDVPDVTHNLGQEILIRILNTSGSTIPNGQVCKAGFVDTPSGFPTALPAQADLFADAFVMGVATHEILDGEYGFLCGHGIIHDIDTSAFSPNDTVYLSETVAGGLTAIAPNIASRIGTILVSDATVGTLYVRIQNLISLPAIFGILDDISTTLDLTTTYQDVTDYTTAEEFNCTVDATAGTISVNNSGKYRISFNVTMTVPSSTSTRTIDIQLWNDTDSAQIALYSIPIPRDTTQVSRSFAIPVDLVSMKDNIIRIQADTTINGVSFDNITFDVESILVR